jgi:RimJ/RimL family protein N-acetyltransferase
MGEVCLKSWSAKNSLTLSIRSGVENDAVLFPAFAKKVGEETNFTRYSTTGNAPNEWEIRSEFQNDILRSDRLHLVAYLDDKMVGYLKFKQPYPQHVGFKHVAEFGIFILSEVWGLRLARFMILEMEQYALSIGVKRIEARVRAGNERALFLFKSVGFQVEGTRYGAVKIGDQLCDELYIGKILC